MATANYWTSPFQVGSHHLARGFVKEGWEVAFVSDPISPAHIVGGISHELRERFAIYKAGGQSDLNGHLWTYVPGALFAPHNKPILRNEFVYRYWAKFTWPNVVDMINQKGFGEVDLLYFDSPKQLFWLNSVKYNKAVFRVADKNSGFAAYTPALQKLEHELAQAVDTVIYTARNLKEYVEAMQPKCMLHIPNGVNFDHFANGQKFVPIEYETIPKPIAIYVGAMDIWFDFDLLNEAAEKLPGVSFVLIGPDKLAQAKLKKLPNIFILGRRDYAALPPYLHNADVGIIPFDVQNHPELVHSINPLKLYEYMACGLPVVAVAWEELKNINSPATLCESEEEFIAGIELAILKSRPRNDFSHFAQGEDWRTRVNKIIEQLDLN